MISFIKGNKIPKPTLPCVKKKLLNHELTLIDHVLFFGKLSYISLVAPTPDYCQTYWIKKSYNPSDNVD